LNRTTDIYALYYTWPESLSRRASAACLSACSATYWYCGWVVIAVVVVAVVPKNDAVSGYTSTC